MAKQELLELIQASSETGIAIPTLRLRIADGSLRGKKIGRKYMINREDLNNFLGITNNDELLKRDMEIAKLKNQLDNYKRQYMTIKQLMTTIDGVINIL